MQVGGLIPFLTLYDRTGEEVYRHVGYKEGDEGELRRQVEALLPQIDQTDAEAVGSEG
jgi:hypothetical protein